MLRGGRDQGNQHYTAEHFCLKLASFHILGKQILQRYKYLNKDPKGLYLKEVVIDKHVGILKFIDLFILSN